MKVKKLKDRNGVVFTPLVSADSVFLQSSSKDLTTKLSELDNTDTVINSKIPSTATALNQLADKAFVNSTVTTSTANYRGTFADWANVPTDPSQYIPDYNGNTTPTQNDYMYVRDSSDYPVPSGTDPLDGVWKFKYVGVWSTNGKNGWQYEFKVNDTVFTQAQSDALNSGINSNLVSDYSAHVADTVIHVTAADKSYWNAKQQAITGAATTITNTDLTVNKVLISDANGKVAVGSIDSSKIVGTDSTQTLTNKTISYADNTLPGIQPTLTGGYGINIDTSTDVITATNIFWGTYGTTTYSDILAAYQANKEVLIKHAQSNTVLGLSNYDVSSNTVSFTCLNTFNNDYWATVDNSNTWNLHTRTLVTITDTQTLLNKTIDKKDNTLIETAQTITENVSLNLTSNSPYYVGKDVRYFIGGSSAITVTLPSFSGTGVEKWSGLVKSFTSNDINNFVTFFNHDGNYDTAIVKAGESYSFKAFYDNSENRLYWKRFVSDIEPTYISQTSTISEIIYDNSNLVITDFDVTLTLGNGDVVGREATVTFLHDGRLIFIDGNGDSQSYEVNENTVSTLTWNGVGWIYGTSGSGGGTSTVVKELPLVPALITNIDQGFVLTASSELSEDNKAFKAFNGHSITYNVGPTVINDDTSFATNGDGNNGYLCCVHQSIKTKYKYLHIIDRGTGDSMNPSTVTKDGITQYTIYGTDDAGTTWTYITEFNKSASKTDVIIQLNTNNFYNGFKIATTGTSGTTRNVGFRKVQMYVPTTATIQKVTEYCNNISAYTPLVPLMTTDSEKGFSLSMSSNISGYEAYHAFNQHPLTYFIGNTAMLNTECCKTNGDGSSAWIACLHPDFKVSYGFVHLIDTGSSSGLHPETVDIDGITEYTVYGYTGSEWEEIVTYSKSSSLTDVVISLDTESDYFGLKVAATGATESGNIGWRMIQIYVSNKQTIQYVSQVDINPVYFESTQHTGMVTYYNSKFVVHSSSMTLTIDSADKLGRECLVIPSEATSIIYTNLSNQSATQALSQNQIARLTWNGNGWLLEVLGS